MSPAKKAKNGDVSSQLLDIERGGGNGAVDFGRGVVLNVTHLGKVYFKKDGVSKGALMRYYADIWPVLKPHIVDRPLILKRHPDGVGGPVFYQQNAGDAVPAGVRVEVVGTGAGAARRLVGGDLQTLLYTVQLGAIEVHPWLSRIATPDMPDRCLIDLDPGDDVPFSGVVRLAKELLKLANDLDLPVALKMSGASGIHLVIPLPPKTSYDTSAELAMGLARLVSLQHPDRATIARSLAARPVGTIYVDAMQNARGKSMASAYSVRAKEGATVSTPIAAAELTARLRTSAFTMRAVQARIERDGDSWGAAVKTRASPGAIRAAIAALNAAAE
jgi:bifunctional non-homologous end joining protein LigD